MLTRKQQWRRMRKVTRLQQHPRSIIDLAANSKKKRHNNNNGEQQQQQQQLQHAACFRGEDVEGEEDTGSSSSSSSSSTSSSFSSAWSSFDSLLDDDNSSGDESGDDENNNSDNNNSSGASSTGSLLDPTSTSPNLVDPSSSTSTTAGVAGAARPKGVSFQQEVQVFLVTHKSELDHSAKRALWWTGRDAAINKRAWLNHLGQPGCGRQSAVRPRKEPPAHQHQEGRASNFLPHNTAAGRGQGIWSAHHNSTGGFYNAGDAVMTGVGARAEEALDAAELMSVGILGCRCEACLTEGDEHEHDHQQSRSTPPPSYSDSRSPLPYNDQPPPPQYYHRPSYHRPPPSPLPPANGGHRSRYARPASKTWPSPADWARGGDAEDDDSCMGFSLGGRSRSYSPASSRQGSSPLREACDSYDDDDDVFPRGSNFFHDDDGDE